MKKYNIALLPGDGVGPEVITQGRRVLEACQDVIKGFELDFQEYYVGNQRYLELGRSSLRRPTGTVKRRMPSSWEPSVFPGAA